MSIDFRAALERLVELDDTVPHNRPGWAQEWSDAIATARAVLAERAQGVGVRVVCPLPSSTIYQSDSSVQQCLDLILGRLNSLEARLFAPTSNRTHLGISEEAPHGKLATHPDGTPMASIGKAIDLAELEADGPAVQSREPASVVGEPSDEELLDIAAQAIDGYSSGIKLCAVEVYGSELIAFARAVWDRAALAQPTGKEPTRLRNCPTHGQQPPWAWGCPECVRQLREELAALQQRPEPVPPSLAKRALHILGTHGDLSCAEHDTIRRALEALDD